MLWHLSESSESDSALALHRSFSGAELQMSSLFTAGTEGAHSCSFNDDIGVTRGMGTGQFDFLLQSVWKDQNS